MKRYRGRIISVLIVICCITLTTLSYRNFTKAAQNNTNSKQIPILNYSSANQRDLVPQAIRQIRNSYYDGRGIALDESPDIDPLPINSHWWVDMPALPVFKSDAVILGEVTDAQAYLSNDKTGIYSEYTVRIADIFKKDQANVLTPNIPIAAIRQGGAIRFDSGRIQQYLISFQGIPQVGMQYVMFLKRNTEDQSYSIITAYKVEAGHIYPLDGEDTELVCSKYKAADMNAFLNEVREAIAKSANNGGKH